MPATRKGSRWLHQEPEESEIKEWFEQQPLHPGMSHGPYMGGIVLIPATEKIKVTRAKQNGDTYVAESERVVFTPYVKVDSRVAYFRDYIRTLNGGNEKGDFIGVIEPVEVPRIDDANSAFYNAHLPQGFSAFAIKEAENKVARYIVCTMRVAIYHQDLKDRPILEGFGSKQTALLRRYPDDNAVMKAETGAVGRALGLAGILVVGTGVATAEDVQEAIVGAAQPATAVDAAEAAELPADAPGGEASGPAVPAEEAPGPAVEEPESPQEADEKMRAHARELQTEMESDHPEAWQQFVAWWKERKFGALSELTGPALKGAVTKLERDLDTAKGGGPKDTGDKPGMP